MGSSGDAHNFVILDGHTGKPLWHFNVGQLIHASPMGYAAIVSTTISVSTVGIVNQQK